MEEPLKTILVKMCDAVNAEYNALDFQSPDWYLGHEWTEDEEKTFKEWFVSFLHKNAQARNYFMRTPTKNKETLKKLADEFVFSYGWKYKKEETTEN
jgi:hypothetical protein